MVPPVCISTSSAPRHSGRALGMNSRRKLASWAVRWGLLGFVSGVLSCAMSESHIVYLVREQKTVDHIVWPGLVFALVVLLPLSRWAGDGWLRTAAALIASSVIYPVAWLIAVSGTRYPGAHLVAEFALAGFLGSFVLAGVFLFRRPHWVRAACATVAFGTLTGGLMGAHLFAAVKGMVLLGRDGLGVLMVVWQTVVGASLGRGMLSRPIKAAAPKGGPTPRIGNSGVNGGPPSVSVGRGVKPFGPGP
jgi:hypothetical protein